LKKTEDTLYKEYCDVTSKRLQETYSVICNKAKKMAVYLTDGIEERGIKRKFDIVDYYLYTQMSLDGFSKLIDGMSLPSKEYYTLKRFIEKNYKSTHIDTRKILNITVVMGIKIDNEGNSIANTGREISKEEKLAVIQWLKVNRIPLTEQTYNIAFNRYYNNLIQLDFSKETIINSRI
jgi:hypothetical protein